MRRFISLAFLLLWVESASSAILPNPVIDDKEWMQLVDVAGYSWNDFDAACDASTGICNGSLSGGQDLTGWIWASIADVNALANHYIGDLLLGNEPLVFSARVGLDPPAPGDGFADRFLQDFDPTGDTVAINGLIQGSVREVDGIFVWNNFDVGILRPADFYGSVNALSDQTSLGLEFDPARENPLFGGWFYRAAPVSSPATIWLFALAFSWFFAVRQSLKTQ